MYSRLFGKLDTAKKPALPIPVRPAPFCEGQVVLNRSGVPTVGEFQGGAFSISLTKGQEVCVSNPGLGTRFCANATPTPIVGAISIAVMRVKVLFMLVALRFFFGRRPKVAEVGHPWRFPVWSTGLLHPPLQDRVRTMSQVTRITFRSGTVHYI